MILALLLALPIFGLVWVVSRNTLKETPLAEGANMIAFCVAILTALGVLRVLNPNGAQSTGLTVDVILLPYGAMGIGFLLVLIILWLLSLLRGRREQRRWTDRPIRGRFVDPTESRRQERPPPTNRDLARSRPSNR